MIGRSRTIYVTDKPADEVLLVQKLAGVYLTETRQDGITIPVLLKLYFGDSLLFLRLIPAPAVLRGP
jgi:hypothetical protein